MPSSIKKNLGVAKLGNLNNKEVRRLLVAALSDLNSLRTTVLALVADANNLQIVVNNLGNAVTNIDVNCTNAVVNYNAITLTAGANTPAALNLTA